MRTCLGNAIRDLILPSLGWAVFEGGESVGLLLSAVIVEVNGVYWYGNADWRFTPAPGRDDVAEWLIDGESAALDLA